MGCTARALVVLAILLRCTALNRYDWCKQRLDDHLDCTNVEFTKDEGIDQRPSDQVLVSTTVLIFRSNGFKTLTGNAPLSMFPRLNNIQILNNELTSISDDFFNGMKTIEILTLTSNNLETIPMAINSLPFLSYLSMQRNKIKGKLNEKSFSCFQIPANLEILDLSYNQIDGIEGSPFIKMTNLKILTLAENEIRIYEGEPFTGLNSLRNLYLGKAEIGDLPVNFFQSMKQLELLDLKGAFKPGIFTLKPDHLTGLSLKELNLEGNLLICDCSIEWLWHEVTRKISYFQRPIIRLTANSNLFCFSFEARTFMSISNLKDGFCVRRVWSSWGPWSECYAVAACKNNITSNFKHRHRECLKTKEMHFSCLGEAFERTQCGTENCELIPAVNGGWSSWSPWSVCSVSCKQGLRTRQRLCDQPKPQGFGHTCNGENVETKICDNKPCPYIKVVESNLTQLAYMKSFLKSHKVTDAKMNAVLEEISNDRPLMITVVSTSVLMLLLYYGALFWLWTVKRKKKNGEKYDETKPTDFNSYNEDVRKKEEDKVIRFLKDKSWFGGSNDTSVLPPMPFKSSELAKKVFNDGFIYDGKFIQNRPKGDSGHPSTPERQTLIGNIYEETTSELKVNEIEGLYVEEPECLTKKIFSRHDDNDFISSVSSFIESSNSFNCIKNDSKVEGKVDYDEHDHIEGESSGESLDNGKKLS